MILVKISLKGMNTEELIAFYDAYVKKHGIFDPKEKRRIWWAMHYCCNEGRSWDV